MRTITKSFEFSTKKAAKEFEVNFNETFPPQGYGTRTNVIQQFDGKWFCHVSRQSSCD